MGVFRGTVTDSITGKRIPDVKITFVDSSVFTNQNGEYILAQFPLASGFFTVEKDFYRKIEIQREAPLPEDLDIIDNWQLVQTGTPIPEEDIIPPPGQSFFVPVTFTREEFNAWNLEARDWEIALAFALQLNKGVQASDILNDTSGANTIAIAAEFRRVQDKINSLISGDTLNTSFQNQFIKWNSGPGQFEITFLPESGIVEAPISEEPPPEELSLFDKLKDLFSKDNFTEFFSTFKQSFTGDLLDGDEGANLMADIVFSLIPIGKVGLAAEKIGAFFKPKEFISVAKSFRLKDVPPLEIERYLAAGKYTHLLEYARTEPRLFGEFLAQSSPEVKSLVLKGLRNQADPTAFNMAVQAIHKVEGAKGLGIFHLLTPITEHKFTTAVLVVSGMGSVLGIDVWGNWAIIDNLSFTLTREAAAARDQFVNGEITKEEALAELDRLINLSLLGASKVRTSAKLNPIQFLFLPLWDEVADENVKLLRTVRSNIEGAATPLPKGRLIINPIPTDADVNVEGQIPTTGVFNREIDIGTYKYTVDKFRFISKSGSVEVFEDATTEINVEIVETVKEEIPPGEVRGVLSISVIPEDAVITVAGQDQIIAAGTFDVPPGTYGVKAEKEGFVSQTKTALVKEDVPGSVSFVLKEILPPQVEPGPTPPIQPKEAAITFTSNPTNADVYINGQYTFTKTPYTTLLTAGDYIFRVQKDGFFPNEIQAEVLEGETDTINFDLGEIPIDQFIPGEFVPFNPARPPGFEPLFPVVQAPLFFEAPLPGIEKELLINIETTDAKPWKGRIFSIAFLNLSNPGATPTVMINENEEELLRQFIEMFNVNEFKRLIGFKLTFDHRYIFNKLMLYRMQSSKWADIELRDVKQLLDQVKEEFVYFPDKTGTLNDYGKSLLGKGKYGPQATLLKMFLAQNIPYVEAFQNRQIEITRDLYDLHRFSSSESLPAASLGSSHTNTSPELPLIPDPSLSPGEKKCTNCLQVNPFDKTECVVCGNKL